MHEFGKTTTSKAFKFSQVSGLKIHESDKTTLLIIFKQSYQIHIYK